MHTPINGHTYTTPIRATRRPLTRTAPFTVTQYFKSLLLLNFGIAATLSCTAPLYEPVLARILRGTRANPQAVGGAVLAFLGVAALSLE